MPWVVLIFLRLREPRLLVAPGRGFEPNKKLWRRDLELFRLDSIPGPFDFLLVTVKEFSDDCFKAVSGPFAAALVYRLVDKFVPLLEARELVMFIL